MRSSTRRTILWALALVVALSLVGLAFVQGDAEVDDDVPPTVRGPHVPDDPGEGCGDDAATDPDDLSVDRVVARCGPGAPEPQPLARATTVRVAVPERTESQAPLLLADALGELEAENVEVELVQLDQADAYARMAAGDIDVVVGGISAPFFDAVHDGVDARLVLGGPVARVPNDLDTPQTGLWLRADLISENGDWDNVEGHTILVPEGLGSAAVYPVDVILGQNEMGPNSVDFTAATSRAAADRLMSAEVGGAWLTEPAAIVAGDDPALMLAMTLPGSEAIEGVVFSPDLVGPQRDTGLAVTRALVRTINTHLADGYDDDTVAVLSEELDVPEDQIASGPEPLFDWEVRSGTMARIQEALIGVGGVRYEQPRPESELVDRTLYDEAVSPG